MIQIDQRKISTAVFQLIDVDQQQSRGKQKTRSESGQSDLINNVYMRSLPYGTILKWLSLRCALHKPAGTVPMGTASHSQRGPLAKSIPVGTIPRQVFCKQVEWFK